MSGCALSIRDIHVSYGPRKVLDGLSLDVPCGEMFGLMGLNGVGKTTMIKSVIGLRDPDSGRIDILGADRLSMQSKRQLAYLPERFDPPWFLTGIEFIKFSLRLYRAPFVLSEVESSAAQLALDPAALRNRVQTYSKGMRQKLGLLATLLTGCPFLILDEPMSGLDPRARAYVKDMLRTVKGQGRTVFLSSHILSDMYELCDRVVVLHDRKFCYEGTPAGLCDYGQSDNIERAFLNVIDGRTAA
ncbi:MAG: ABC transporter ATP-binding protein [Micavibrio aeruginosavorus]|uniref:ABC transporter ATP-binding protein n=1 Tax=Micavibrio aeruginosavorus TaxID=349221 RepID=A0A7T5R1B0_9BACT|nr:MAG: ABC transporter ATP-binding protein [Micavibrio aeruginosavorus]